MGTRHPLDPAVVLALRVLTTPGITPGARRRAAQAVEMKLIEAADQVLLAQDSIDRLHTTNHLLRLERDLAIELAGYPTFEHRTNKHLRRTS